MNPNNVKPRKLRHHADSRYSPIINVKLGPGREKRRKKCTRTNEKTKLELKKEESRRRK